jgi:hypothetical protein
VPAHTDGSLECGYLVSVRIVDILVHEQYYSHETPISSSDAWYGAIVLLGLLRLQFRPMIAGTVSGEGIYVLCAFFSPGILSAAFIIKLSLMLLDTVKLQEIHALLQGIVSISGIRRISSCITAVTVMHYFAIGFFWTVIEEKRRFAVSDCIHTVLSLRVARAERGCQVVEVSDSS